MRDGALCGVPVQPWLCQSVWDVAGNGGIANPFPFTTPAPGAALNWVAEGYYYLTLNAFAANYVAPYTYNFNLNIQREFGIPLSCPSRLRGFAEPSPPKLD